MRHTTLLLSMCGLLLGAGCSKAPPHGTKPAIPSVEYDAATETYTDAGMPVDMTPVDMTPTDMTPTDMTPTDMTPVDVDAGDTFASQGGLGGLGSAFGGLLSGGGSKDGGTASDPLG